MSWKYIDLTDYDNYHDYLVQLANDSSDESIKWFYEYYAKRVLEGKKYALFKFLRIKRERIFTMRLNKINKTKYKIYLKVSKKRKFRKIKTKKKLKNLIKYIYVELNRKWKQYKWRKTN